MTLYQGENGAVFEVDPGAFLSDKLASGALVEVVKKAAPKPVKAVEPEPKKAEK